MKATWLLPRAAEGREPGPFIVKGAGEELRAGRADGVGHGQELQDPMAGEVLVGERCVWLMVMSPCEAQQLSSQAS